MGAVFDMAMLREVVCQHQAEACWLAEERNSPLSSSRQRVLGGLAGCGDPYQGFVWLRCEPCGVDHVQATSCKKRVLCPRCGGRRMASTAVHLVERVLPDCRLRQWVVTLPQPLPRLLAWRPEMLARILSDISVAVRDDVRRRSGEPTGHSGMVSFIQNFAGDLRCFVHVHALVPDGVFVEDGEHVRFAPARTPTRDDIQRVAERLAARVQRSCELWRRGVSMEDEPPQGVLEQLATLGQQLVVGPARRQDRPSARQRRWLGAHLGVGVHGGVTVAKGDVKARERLVRYVARPALSLERLELKDDAGVHQVQEPVAQWQQGRAAAPGCVRPAAG
jgi:DNA-directed RNA polymerase subunit RPC12/RpoP